MIFRAYEASRRTYDRITFGIKMLIVAGIIAVIFVEYRDVMSERSELQTTDARSPKDAVTERLYGMVVSVSNVTE